MRFIIGSGLIILLTSCAATMTNYYTPTVQSWRGGNINTLYQRWGRPDGRFTGPNGNVVYVYNTSNYRSNSAPSSPAIGVNFTPGGKAVVTATPNTNNWNRGPQSLTCSSTFMVNPKGVIIDTQVSGNNCYGSESFANRMRNPK